MTGDLRVIESEIGPVIPLVDVAHSVGRDRSAITKALHKPENASLFVGLLSIQAIRTRAKTRMCQCITKAGMDILIPLLRPINRDNMPQRIATFRAAQMQKNTFSAPQLSDVLTEYGKRARALSSEWGVDPGGAQRVAMADAVEKYPDLTPYRNLVGSGDKPHDAIPELPAPDLPKADPDFEKYFPLPKIAEMCKIDESTARRILEDEGIIGFENKHTTLSTRGALEDFGRVFTCYPYFPHRMTPRGHIRYNSDKCCHLIREKLFGIQAPLSGFQRVPPSKGG